MNRAIGAARQRFADHLLHARRTRGAHHHFAAMLLAQAQRLFERIGVGLVHLVADVLVADPRLVVVQAWLPLARWDLFDADCDLHFFQAPRPSSPQALLLVAFEQQRALGAAEAER